MWGKQQRTVPSASLQRAAGEGTFERQRFTGRGVNPAHPPQAGAGLLS